MLHQAFVYFELRAHTFRACVCVQFFVWRGSLISYTEEGLSLKHQVNQLLYDTFRSLFSLIFGYYHGGYGCCPEPVFTPPLGFSRFCEKVQSQHRFTEFQGYILDLLNLPMCSCPLNFK